MLKFASMIIAYNEEKLIKGCLEGLTDLFNIVSISTPWKGEHKSFDKTREIAEEMGALVIRENFRTEGDQRNRVIQEAKKRRYDYIFVIDVDEYYRREDIKKAMQFIEKNPAERYNVSACISFWKDENWETIPRVLGVHPVCYKTSLKFKELAFRNIDNVITLKLPNDICMYHFTFAGSDNRIIEKLSHFSHAHQVKKDWFKNVWKKWTPEMENIHPCSPLAFKKAVPFKCPEDIKNRYLKSKKLC